MEIESAAALDAWLAAGRPLAGLRLQNLDLTAAEDRLLERDPHDLVVLGGTVGERLQSHLRRGGALVFPAITTCPINPYRHELYSPHELYTDLDRGYDATPDSLTYRWWLDLTTHDDVLATMLRAVHDDSISDALREVLAGRDVVGVMGGHAVQRGDEHYLQAALLGHRLARLGVVVLTGGGPGAMEAASLGAMLHRHDEPDVTAAATRLAAVPSFRPDLTAWADVAFAVRDELHHDGELTSVGVPTWFYGHEPSHVFADAVAKFFSNALREDLLLAHSRAGLVVLPGAAGTVQEVFQAATRAYYAAPGQQVPIVLVDRRHWTSTLPVWPLLAALGAGREMAANLHLVDSVAEAAEVVVASRPGPAVSPPGPAPR